MRLEKWKACSRLMFPLFASTMAGFGQTLRVEVIANPQGVGSLPGHRAIAQNGSPLLSWIKTSEDGSYVLRYAIRSGAEWPEPHLIIANHHFFRQPPEFSGNSGIAKIQRACLIK